MRIAYFDCASGISGDMTLGALVDAGADLAELNRAIQTLGLPGVRLRAQEVQRHGFRATHITVEHEPEHKHRHLHHIVEIINGSALTARQKDIVRQIFTRLAEAEAKVHGTTIDKVHFHEVGAIDSIADIVGTAIGWDLLGIDRGYCSAIPTGTGFIEIAHGRSSVPAPATAELLKGVPLAESHVASELTTPTGAAIVASLVSEFGPVPPMRVDRIGYGAGSRDLEEQANLLRLLVGEAIESDIGHEQIWVLETNLDDASGELVGHATDRLRAAGALDVYTTAIQMKKNRPGVKISVLCRADKIACLEDLLFRETTTLGIRRWPASRRTLRREQERVETPWGPVEGVLSWIGNADEPRFSPEFESCRQLSEDHGVPLREVYEAAQRAFRSQNST